MTAAQRLLSIIPSLLFLTLLVLVLAGTATQPLMRWVEAAPANEPPCPTHTAAMTLEASNTTPKVGEIVLVTATLANEGCSGVGLPQYRLYMRSDQSPPVLVPNPPEPITHILGIGPGQSDSAEFVLKVVGSGQVALTSSSSFEVHLGYPGPAYWAGDATEPVTVTVPLTDTEVSVLQQAAYENGCFPNVRIEGATYSFDCLVAAGHSAHVELQRFPDKAQALAAFEAAQGSHALRPFHCFPAYEWLDEQRTAPVRQVGRSWVADRWLVTTRSFDDTVIPVAPSPVAFSEAVYKAAVANQLFQGCAAFYLPLVFAIQ